jgi:hypothetical protein
MGNVKDCYFKYAESGDQYVGRCIALLPVLHVDLAISPPYFSETADLEWVTEMVKLQFHCMKSIGDFGLLLKMCLATMIFHHRWIVENLVENHVVRTTSVCFRNAQQLERIEKDQWIVVSYPWSAPHLSFSGIPPYCALLQHISEVRSEQKSKIIFFSFLIIFLYFVNVLYYYYEVFIARL